MTLLNEETQNQLECASIKHFSNDLEEICAIYRPNLSFLPVWGGVSRAAKAKYQLQLVTK